MLLIGNRLANERSINENDQIRNLNSESQLDLRFAKKSPLLLQRRLTPPPPPPPRQEFRDDAQMVDFASSFLFPLSFIIFNIIYWMVISFSRI